MVSASDTTFVSSKKQETDTRHSYPNEILHTQKLNLHMAPECQLVQKFVGYPGLRRPHRQGISSERAGAPFALTWDSAKSEVLIVKPTPHRRERVYVCSRSHSLTNIPTEPPTAA